MAWLIVMMYTGDGKNILKLSLQVILGGGGQAGRGIGEKVFIQFELEKGFQVLDVFLCGVL